MNNNEHMLNWVKRKYPDLKPCQRVMQARVYERLLEEASYIISEDNNKTSMVGVTLVVRCPEKPYGYQVFLTPDDVLDELLCGEAPALAEQARQTCEGACGAKMCECACGAKMDGGKADER